jgi:hypothetical protein
VAEPTVALAHDSFLAHDLAWRGEGSGSDFGASTNRGLIFKSKAGARLLCHEAIQAHPSERLPLVSVQDGWLVATSGGVIHLDRAGCPDESAPRLSEGAVQELLRAPEDPRRLYAVTADANVGSGLYLSEDEGASFRALLQLEGQQFYNAVVVAPAPEGKLYLSGASYDAETSVIEHFVDVYSPEGDTVRHAISLSSTETQVRMLAADLRRVFVRVAGTADGSTPDRLLVSEGGGPWETLFVAAGIRQLSFGADGESLWLASAEGLFFSESGERFEHQELTWNPSCVEPRGDELVLCDALGIHIATEPSKPETLMFFAEVTAPVSCDGSGQPLPACEGQWADFYTELPGLPTSRPSIVEADAGTLAELDAATVGTDAGRGNDGEPKTREATQERSGCGLAQRSTPLPSNCGSLTWSWGLWSVAVAVCLGRLRRARRAA